ncbi:MAG: DMT family transporter [candidate division Zixibacteria bacterium]|nr:DMT family transporter [candidate division Zixibacteria bacterium]
MPYPGELAALSTAILWSFTSLFFTSASRRIGSYWLNKIRILFAVMLLGITLLLITGELLPPDIPVQSYYFLILSGVIGLSIGDAFLFRAYVVIGPRLSLLIFSISPIITAIIAWFFLGERLGIQAIWGITMTVAGMGWVTVERYNVGTGVTIQERKKLKLGIFLAFGGATGQAIGLILAKAGMGNHLEPLPATFIRMLSAGIAIWLFSLLRGDIKEAKEKFRDKKALILALGGAICGPFLGVWMSLVAIKYVATGIAAAIMSIVPVLVIPLVIIFYKEKVSSRAVIGAIITVAGVILLFYR